MHIIVAFKEPAIPQQPMAWLIRTAHRWLATGGKDRFSFDISGQRVNYPQPCTYSDKLKRDLCRLLGDNNAVTVENEPIRQLSLMDVKPISTTNYGD